MLLLLIAAGRQQARSPYRQRAGPGLSDKLTTLHKRSSPLKMESWPAGNLIRLGISTG
jgi:hypothetical protein